MTEGVPPRRLFPILGRNLALVFALLRITLAVLIAVEWLWVLEPRLAADARSRSSALAQGRGQDAGEDTQRQARRSDDLGSGMALQASDTEPFDLTLLELWMPTMNGFEAARRIRELPDPEMATIPIMALTADVTHEAATESRRSGICEVVAKPTSPDKLAGFVRTHCNGYRARQSSR